MTDLPQRRLADMPAALPDVLERAGRPPIPPEQWRETILEEIAGGAMLTELCAREGWPSRSTVYRWFAADEDFWNAYRAKARLMGADAVAEKAYLGAQTAEDAAKGTLAWRAAVWMAAKMNPAKYGDRVALDHADGRRAEDYSDDDLAAIAAGGGARAAAAKGSEA